MRAMRGGYATFRVDGVAVFLEWASMGGYGAFVWPGYALSLAGLVWIVARPAVAHRRAVSRMNEGRGR